MSFSRSDTIGDPHQCISPEALCLNFLNEDDFVKASRETIFGVVSELLDVTVKKLASEDHVQSTPNSCQSRIKGKQKSVCDASSCDLPVRRSSRIQSKIVKKDDSIKKKPNAKEEETKFIDVVSVEEEKEIVKEVNEIVEVKSNVVLSPQSPNVKVEQEKAVKKNKDNTPRTPKTQRRSQKKSDKKEEVKAANEKKSDKNEEVKPSNEKPKPERRRYASRKRKQEPENISESDNDNKVPVDDTFKTIIKEGTVSVSHLTRNSLKTQDSFEVKVPAEVFNSSKSDEDKTNENSDTNSDNSLKPVKVKSRWWRSSELEGVLKTEPVATATECPIVSQVTQDTSANISDVEPTNSVKEDKEYISENPKSAEIENVSSSECVVSSPLLETVEKPSYDHIEENIYRFERKKSKSKKQVRRMICDCTLTKEEQECGMLGCKEECLNRLLMIECGSRCPIGVACSNKKFQNKEYIKAEIFKAEKKGWGLQALETISSGDFLMEFVGEVLNHKEYRQRVKQYAKDKNVHSYFMALKTDEILDATVKGNFTRFINHSCDPNCETQKWTVNGELRVGVFAKRTISIGEEFTLDYQFQRYGREAQKCYCGSYNCSGYIGGTKQISIDAYSSTKTGNNKRKKGSEEKKRDWEDMTLEEEIERLNGFKGLRNREETLKFARLMVRADDNATRHQLLDIMIKTEEQACLRLFLDYHGLPLLWSWMTDVVDLDLKTKILQVLQLLPIANKTMLIDSKVMSIVEKWVQECDVIQKDFVGTKDPALALSTAENPECLVKRIKMLEFSDSETDSSGSMHVNDNSENKPSTVENISSKPVFLPSEIPLPPPSTENMDFSPSDIPLPDSVPQSESSNHCSKLDTSIETSKTLRKDISSVGSELLCTWKNLKEVFRIPRLEQQKQRKEDEREADHSVLSRIQAEVKRPEPEITGNQIQVLIARKITDNTKNFDYDNPENYNNDHRNRNKSQSANKLLRRVDEDINEDSLEDSESPILSCGMDNGPIPQHSCRPALCPIPTYISPPPVNFPPTILPTTVQPPPLSIPEVAFPPPVVYPQGTQVNFLNTIPPLNIAHTPTNVPPPSALLPKQLPPPMLQQPPLNVPPPCQPINPGIQPISTNYILPPNVPPVSVVSHSSQYMPNQTPPISNYPNPPNLFGNQNQQFYYVQQPSTAPNPSSEGNFPENVPMQSMTTIPFVQTTSAAMHTNLPMQGANPLQAQAMNPVPLSSTNMLPVQSLNPLPLQSTFTMQENMEPSPIIEETKPLKLPKNWRSATDPEGNTYYYHSATRVTQWDPPTPEEDDNSEDEEEEVENSISEDSESSDTPTYDEPTVTHNYYKRKSKKRKTTKAAADTSVSFPVRPEIAKKIKELFRTKMSSFIVQCLNHYRKADCKVGRITNNEDFKYLARKLTHYIMTKEIKQLKNVEDLDCNETVTHKAKDFIKKYMSKYGSKYNRKEKCSPT